MALLMIVEVGFVTGRDHAEDAVGRALDQRQPSVAGPGRRLEDLRPRRLVDDQVVLLDLVFDAAQSGLLPGHPCQELGVGAHRRPHRRDDLVAFVERCGIQRPECAPGGRHGAVQVGVDAVLAADRRLRRRSSGASACATRRAPKRPPPMIFQLYLAPVALLADGSEALCEHWHLRASLLRQQVLDSLGDSLNLR